MAEEPAVPLSIVVGTIQGWPEIEPNLRSFEAAAKRVGAEVIVVDGSGQPPPPTDLPALETQWIDAPGTSVFQARYAGYRRARGAIVAITEDHCLTPPV